MPLLKINIVFCDLSSSFDAAATAHPEYYDKVKLILRALGLPNDS